MSYNSYKSGISICISAYKADKFIEETLDSVAAQTWFEFNNNWEVIVGIDGCKETLAKVQDIMGKYDSKHFKFYMMDSNKGTYITTNTVMSIAQYDGLLRFDADDIMLPDLVETIMLYKANNDYISFNLKNFLDAESNGSLDRPQIQKTTGQIYIRKYIFEKYGGYKPWPCSADAELKWRLKHVSQQYHIDKVLMLRRIHLTNLTVAKETNKESDVRKKINSMIKHNIKTDFEATIKKVTNTCKRINKNSVVEIPVLSAINENTNKVYRKVVYTYSDKANSLMDPKHKCNDWDYICFSSKEQKSSVWKTMPLPEHVKKLRPEKQENYVKIHPHELLKEYEISIYVDSDIWIIDNINNFIKLNAICMNDWLAYTTMNRHCTLTGFVKNDAEYNVNKTQIKKQIAWYTKKGLKDTDDLINTDVLIRRHNVDQCISLMNTWWNHIQNYSNIDEYSLSFFIDTHPSLKVIKLPQAAVSKYFE